MRTLCDACESAAALVFCAADEASLCGSCDDKVHTCNKLASRHLRVGLADPVEVPRCDICENAPAFFYCEMDGSSLCLQCDMAVHVGSKRSHERYLLFKQRVEFPGDKTAQTEELTIGQGKNKVGRNKLPKPTTEENQEIQKNSKKGTAFDLNVKPQRTQGEASNHQE